MRVNGSEIPGRHRLRGLRIPRRRHIGVRPVKDRDRLDAGDVPPMRIGAREMADQRRVGIADIL